MKTVLLRAAALGAIVAAVAFLALARGPSPAVAGNGYAFDDTAPFNWVDACAAGSTLVNVSDADDDFESTGPFGFTFNFAGTDYTQAEATSNGVISLDAEGNNQFANEALPTVDFSGPALFPWWDDLDTVIAGQVCVATVGDAPNRAFVVQWDAVALFEGAADFTVSFEAVMCEGSNNVVFQYLDAVFGDTQNPQYDNAGDATVGTQENSSVALQYSFNEPVITDNLAIVFYPTGGSATSCVAAEAPTPTATAPAPTETPGPEGSVSVSVSDTSVTVGEDVDVTATVVDGAGNPVAGVDCSFSIVDQPGTDASVDAGPVATDAEGKATTTLDTGSTPGTVQVQAECGAFTEILDVVVAPALPSTGAGDGFSGAPPVWLFALAAALAAAGLGALSLRARRA